MTYVMCEWNKDLSQLGRVINCGDGATFDANAAQAAGRRSRPAEVLCRCAVRKIGYFTGRANILAMLWPFLNYSVIIVLKLK